MNHDQQHALAPPGGLPTKGALLEAGIARHLDRLEALWTSSRSCAELEIYARAHRAGA